MFTGILVFTKTVTVSVWKVCLFVAALSLVVVSCSGNFLYGRNSRKVSVTNLHVWRRVPRHVSAVYSAGPARTWLASSCQLFSVIAVKVWTGADAALLHPEQLHCSLSFPCVLRCVVISYLNRETRRNQREPAPLTHTHTFIPVNFSFLQIPAAWNRNL
jgi:hypothetical protein